MGQIVPYTLPGRTTRVNSNAPFVWEVTMISGGSPRFKITNEF
jgi:hypothetical protein